METVQDSQFAIRKAVKHEVPQMATVLYQSYRRLSYWETCCSLVEEQDWVESQADVCLQYIGERNSLAFVAEGGEGEIIGTICGRFLNSTVPSATVNIPIAGIAVDEMQKMNNGSYQATLIEKYGDFLWISAFAVLPPNQGHGIGKALLACMMDEAKARRVNVALAGSQGAKRFYERHGFVEDGPPRMLAEGTIQGRSVISGEEAILEQSGEFSMPFGCERTMYNLLRH
ncbi:hypothetical protein QFC21_004765 [Naganishia friedmannii]|uniref:Uncharacterized protein n=1 Tax=Naganishia friedmannii TaxID=89922 RepID=A0ACC2VGM5_9TREE|nr:hypothetical protein QFC21_004765 [Naganishia friedmannii]